MNETLVRSVFDALSITSILVLLVLGMTVIVGMMKVFNLCQGELVLLGALTAYLTYTYLGSVLIGIVLAPLVVGLVGFILERTVIHRFYKNPRGALLATFAIGLVIREALRANMSAQSSPVPAPLSGSVAVLGAQLPVWRMIIFITTVLLVAVCGVVLIKSNIGLKIRATLDNPELVSATGISTRWMYAGTYAFGSALAGFAGAMVVPLQTLYPNLGFDNLIPMFLAVMVGGLGSFVGPILGAIGIALPMSALSSFGDQVTAQIFVVLAAILFMRFRPNGLVSGGG